MERERLARIAKVALRHSENPDLGLAAEIVDLEDRLAEKFEEAVSLANEVAKMEGPKGEPGEDGADADEEEIIERVIPAVIAAIPVPENGKDGRDGRDGKDGRDGIDGKDGVDGVDGKDGEPGTPGRDGSPDTGEQIVEKVNKSKGKRISAERLDLDDIRSGIAQVAAINRGPGGSTGLEKVTGPSFSRQGVSELSFSGSTVTVSRTGNGVNVDIGGGVDTDEKVKVSANDTTGGYLNGKLVAGTGITLTENNNGGDETLTIANTLDLSAYVPYTGATGDLNLGTHAVIAHAVRGDASDGILLEASNGTDIGILGAANTANVTWYGSHNFDTATADTIAAFGSSKTLQSLSTSTYPSLTELSYVKGVTSAIQTQLDGKQAAGTYVTGATDSTLTLTGTTLGLNLGNANTWTALQTKRLTTKQDQWEYDASNYANITVGSTGTVTFDAVGSGAKFSFSDSVGVGVGQTDGGTGAKLYVSTGIYTPGWVWATSGLYLTAANQITISPDLSTAVRLTGSGGLQFITSGGFLQYDGATGFKVYQNNLTTYGSMRVGTLYGSYDGSNYYSVTVGSTGGVTFDAVGSGAGFTFSDDVIMADAKNVQTNATTGTKFGTATTQKLGFFNQTPRAQPNTTGTTNGFTANTSANAVFSESTFTGDVGSAAYTVGDIVNALKTLGFLAS